MSSLHPSVPPKVFCEFVRRTLGGERLGVYRCGALSSMLFRLLSLAGYTPECRGGIVQGVDHIWVVCDGEIYDPTSGQFEQPVHYPEGEPWKEVL